MKQPKQTHENKENADNKDTFSYLPDCILIHILSFLNIKEAVQTCILSSRWEHLWKHLSALTLNSSDFKTDKGFMEFVNGILSLRDYSTALNVLSLNVHYFKCPDQVQSHVLKSIVRYAAASQNINRLRLCGISQFPSSLLSCRSLTSLDIVSPSFRLQFPNSLNLPALTYLKLHCVFFSTGNDGHIDPFSNLNKLNTLILYGCIIRGAKLPLCISNTTLLNLSMGYANLSLSIELFAPRLCTFALKCKTLQKLSGSHLSSIEQANIDVDDVMHPLDLLNWLIGVTNIKSLTVTLPFLQALSLVPDISDLKLSCLCNLKSLKINLRFQKSYYRYPGETSWRDIKLKLSNGKSWKENVMLQETIFAGLKPIYSIILDGMIDFLLQNCRSTKVEIMSGS